MTTRRSFLSALLSLPVIGRLWPRKARKPLETYLKCHPDGSRRYITVKEMHKRNPDGSVSSWISIDGGPYEPYAMRPWRQTDLLT